MKVKPFPILACLCLAASLALACRYTVRDIGFIDLAGRVYTLWIVTDDPSSPEAAGALAHAASQLELTNIDHRLLDTRTQPEHALAGDPRLVLQGPGDRTLDLGPISGYADATTGAISSPIRDDILEHAAGTFATILLIESADPDANTRAVAEIDRATAAFLAMAPTLPREVTTPVRHVTLARSSLDAERVLLWSLGFEQPAQPTDQPIIAVLYGRLKLAGPVLVGDGLTARSLTSQLSLVGESCECEANRDWVNEPTLPHRWTEATRRAAATALGFDPGSPMVQSEALRIIRRGVLTNSGSLRPRAADSQDPLTASFFGYSELTIGEPTTNPPEVAVSPTDPIQHRTLSPETGSPKLAGDTQTEAQPSAATQPNQTAQQISNPKPRANSIRSLAGFAAVGGMLLLGAIGAAVIFLTRKPPA